MAIVKPVAFSVPQLPVELFDAIIASFDDLVNRHRGHKWFILKMQGKGDKDVTLMRKEEMLYISSIALNSSLWIYNISILLSN